MFAISWNTGMTQQHNNKGTWNTGMTQQYNNKGTWNAFSNLKSGLGKGGGGINNYQDFIENWYKIKFFGLNYLIQYRVCYNGLSDFKLV